MKALALLALLQSLQTSVAELSRDTVAVGEPFELRLSVYVPPGGVAGFPDTLPATDAIESLAPVAWSSELVAGGGSRLVLSYPLIAFRAGSLAVPGLEVRIDPAGGEPDLIRFPRHPVYVAPTLTPERLRGGVAPAPPDDVAGPNRHWPSTGAALFFSAALVGLIVSAGLKSLGAPRRAAVSESQTPATLAEARLAAIAELDRLLGAEGRGADVRELYRRASGAVRRYVERFDPAWGPDLTVTELLGRLDGRAHRRGPPGDASSERPILEPLRRELLRAEVVKFGRARPDAAEAQRHLLALRAWVEGTEGRP